MAREYTHPDVFDLGVTQGWAEAETDPARIDWTDRQARAAIPFEVIDGRPVNPCEKTGITRGRNEMGFWGEQKMADALVTFTAVDGTRYLLMIERGDGYGWAVPGGHVEPGETGLQAAFRELAEETGIQQDLFFDPAMDAELPARYVPDPRSSDEAWATTIPVHVNLGDRDAAPAVSGADDARRAAWIPADTYGQLCQDLDRHFGGRVFAAHVAMLGDFLAEATPHGVRDSCPSWCEGCDAEGTHVTDFAGAPGVRPGNDDEALARLVQEGDGAALVELGVNDAGGTAAIRMSLTAARELRDLLDDLITAGALG